MDFLAFQVVAGLPHCQVNTEILLIMEFIHLKQLVSTHIANYMAALRAFHIVHCLQTHSVREE